MSDDILHKRVEQMSPIIQSMSTNQMLTWLCMTTFANMPIENQEEMIRLARVIKNLR